MIYVQRSTQKRCFQESKTSIAVNWNAIQTEFMGVVVTPEASKAHAFKINLSLKRHAKYYIFITTRCLKYIVRTDVSSSHIYVHLQMSEMDTLRVTCDAHRRQKEAGGDTVAFLRSLLACSLFVPNVILNGQHYGMVTWRDLP